jgi:hypothetical protein
MSTLLHLVELDKIRSSAIYNAQNPFFNKFIDEVFLIFARQYSSDFPFEESFFTLTLKDIEGSEHSDFLKEEFLKHREKERTREGSSFFNAIDAAFDNRDFYNDWIVLHYPTQFEFWSRPRSVFDRTIVAFNPKQQILFKKMTNLFKDRELSNTLAFRTMLANICGSPTRRFMLYFLRLEVPNSGAFFDENGVFRTELFCSNEDMKMDFCAIGENQYVYAEGTIFD